MLLLLPWPPNQFSCSAVIRSADVIRNRVEEVKGDCRRSAISDKGTRTYPLLGVAVELSTRNG